ncbi:head decoration protein [Bradyrhizobium sp. C-145]|uniref:head decoration protein n=1 Tax=Bradyrhizobium sp. C-145 TaxID=574727 RepID=UPI00201B6874|nr:head decoration protein [Bradyrhizobium sp. C-145]UQR66210.1 head decoration protein [Bradyrhizobium sp. C-145]
MPTIFIEGRHPAEFILTEANGQRSRDNITIGASQTIVPGTVLGMVTADGSYLGFTTGAADGSQNAAAIAIYGVTTGAGETAKIAAITRDAEVNGNILTWPAGITALQKATAIAALAANGIIVR